MINNTVSGKVTSAEDNQPLPGVNVVIKGTNMGTVTDIEGNYQLKLDDTDSDPSLVFAFIGLESKEVDVKSRDSIDVQLNADVQQLSEVVVTGYGVENEPYESTFTPSQPSVGKSAYKDYLEQNIKYPTTDESEKGRVVIKMKVLPNGILADFEVVKSMGEVYDNEALRLIKEGPGWNPAERDGAKVEDIVKVRVKFDRK
nr:carboxypeptidase-like regulatory domain-containing protein [Fulvivirga aurantia]